MDESDRMALFLDDEIWRKWTPFLRIVRPSDRNYGELPKEDNLNEQKKEMGFMLILFVLLVAVAIIGAWIGDAK